MLHAPTSETKNETTQSKIPSMPVQEHSFYPPGALSQYAQNGIGGAASVRSPEVQQRQTLSGLQTTHGNQAVLRMLHSPQQVARMTPLRPSHSMMLQRECACGGTPGPTGECAECKAKREASLQRLTTNQTAAPVASSVPPIVHEVLSSPGQQLDANTRAFMEPRFGQDFSQVRVHTDAKAAESARAVNALAYTVGKDVVFGTGQYAPQMTEGKRILAHELTHVVQQSRRENTTNSPGSLRPLQRQPLNPAQLSLPMPGTSGSQDILIIDTSPPKLGSCGQASWQVQFALPTPAPQDGWIIQEINFIAFTAGNNAPDDQQQYWEAWPVSQGQTTTGASGPDDQFFIPGDPNSSTGGSQWMLGLVKFYPGPLPPEFGSYNQGDPQPMTYTRPSIWNDTGTVHILVTAWECRPGQTPYNQMLSQGGSRFRRTP